MPATRAALQHSLHLGHLQTNTSCCGGLGPLQARHCGLIQAPLCPLPPPPLPQTNTSYYEELGAQCLANSDDPSAHQCMTQLVRSLVTATAAASLISTFFIGYFGNLPLALAPGIGEAAGRGRPRRPATGAAGLLSCQ